MATYSTIDFLGRPSDIFAEVDRGHVTLTRSDGPDLVLMSIADFNKLRARADCRVAQRTVDMSDELSAEIAKAIEAYEREEN